MEKQSNNKTISELWSVDFEETFKRVFSVKDIDDFSKLSKDKSPIHKSLEKALKKGFENVVVHGCLITSGFSYLIGMKIPGEKALLLEIKTKFHNPLYPNENVIYSARISSIHESINCLNLKLLAIKDNGIKVCSGNAIVKVLL